MALQPLQLGASIWFVTTVIWMLVVVLVLWYLYSIKTNVKRLVELREAELEADREPNRDDR